MLIQNAQRKSSDEMILDLFGTTPDKLQYLVLSNEDTVQPKYAYEDGQRTDEITGKSVTLHIVRLGQEIEVKIEDPNFTLKSRGLEELKQVLPIDLQVSYVNNRYYFKASDLRAVKGAE